MLERRLLSLDEKKKIRIINSAMEEFGRNTFNKASTNRIVEKAGISKGSLFYHFQSKEKLYDYLEMFSIRSIADAIVEKMDWAEPDLLMRIKDITIIKMEVCRKYPHLLGFSKRIHENKSMDDLKALYEKFVPKIYEKIYHENLDLSLFKEDIETNKVLNIMIWTFERMGENYLKRIESGEEITIGEISDEVDRYIEVLRKGFYR